jgi:hypothetical protein
MVCRIFPPRYGTNPTMMAGLAFAAATLLAPPASAATSGVVNPTAGEARQVWLGPTYWWLRVCNEACGWEAAPDLYCSRSRLWRGIHPAALRDGHSRPTNGTAIAMAECLC